MAKKEERKEKKKVLKKKTENPQKRKRVQRVIKRGKKYSAAKKLVEKRLYNISEAVSLAKKVSISKFVGTLEGHLKIGVDLAKPEQLVRGTVDLPHGTGKETRVIYFSDNENEVRLALEAGAIKAGGDDLLDEVQKGFLGFDVSVSSPSFMTKLSKVARILGPRGLMPSPKDGTITTDPQKTISEIKKGKVSFRTDKTGVIHVPLGKLNFEDEKLIENARAFVNQVKSLKPSGQKGKYLISFSVAPTMGPGIKVDLSSIS